MKTIEEYATDLVCDGAESVAEDDIDEDGDLATDDEHEAATALAMDMIHAIRDHADEVIAWARGKAPACEDQMACPAHPHRTLIHEPTDRD